MSLNKINPTKTKSWGKLKTHFKSISSSSIKSFFNKDPEREKILKIEWGDFLIDYSKNRITPKTINLLVNLAEELNLKESIKKYFTGEKINQTENRAVLHTALRSKQNESVLVDGLNVIPEIHNIKNKIKNFSNEIISGKYKGYSGKSITDIVNVGIGGSDLGPSMINEALKFYSNHLNIHFVSNVDGDHVRDILKKIKPETTIFIIVSKTFSTQETLTNASTIKKWFLKSTSKKHISKHFIAVSSAIKKIREFGIKNENIFPMKNWIGGRFSVWSSVGISISLSIGPENFNKLLKGAHKMDTHFKESRFEKNIPVILALISVWYNNFYNSETEVILPYSEYLKKLPSYLQQAVMESNGKNFDRSGDPIDYQTGNIIWGSTGTNSQHAFFQLMHQGTKIIPSDFIGFIIPLYNEIDHHQKLMSNYFAQTEALMNGKNAKEVERELKESGLSKEEIKKILPFKVFKGNNPSNSILIKKLTPESLGSLIAMYEHKIFVQGIIWNIFSFDQWGVELGKKLAQNILLEIQGNNNFKHDPSTANLIKKYKLNS